MSNLDSQQPFSLSGPPRSVPLLVTLRMLFGGFLNQFGWLFFGFGMIFFWVFACNADYAGLVGDWGAVETATGTVTRSEGTGASEGGGKHSKGAPIIANHYWFKHDGQTHEGVSYATGRRLAAGQAVVVEYPANQPSRSRIQGMRTSVFGPVVGLTAIFPLVGLGLIGTGFWNGWKARRLMRDGEQAHGKLTDKQPTSTRINNQRVYALTFTFQDRYGQARQVIARTHRVQLLEDDAEEPLLYDPLDSTQATLLDHLPGSPRMDASGEIILKNPLGSLLVLILPLLSLVGHGCVVWFWWLA